MKLLFSLLTEEFHSKGDDCVVFQLQRGVTLRVNIQTITNVVNVKLN